MTKRTSNKTRPRSRVKKKSPATNAQKSDGAKRPGGKLGLILDRLGRKTGATIDELVDATGWQKHSVHGALIYHLNVRLVSYQNALRATLIANHRESSGESRTK